MTTTVTKRADGVAVLTLKNPPVNSLSRALMESYCANLTALLQDASVKAVVVTGDGKLFCGGAAIDEMPSGKSKGGANTAVNLMGTMASLMDSAKKTIVAAINGPALGGGLEVALMCGARAMSLKAIVGLPEVNLGLLPGGQGTQRLPRVCGVEAALDVMLNGTPVPAQKALAMGIVDVVAPPAQLIDAAAKLALEKAPVSIPSLPVRDAANFSAIAAKWEKQTAKKRRGEIAPRSIIAAVKAACEAPTFEQGLAEEQRLFQGLMKSSESAALRGLFFAEREAAKIPFKDRPVPVKSVGIVGSGTMGGGIAMCFANIGVPVTILDVKQEFLDRGLAVVRKNYARKLKGEQLEKRMSLITGTVQYGDLANVDLVIEAVFEDLALKQKIFKQLDQVCKPSCFLCTNTSGLDVDAVAAATSRPEMVMGAHFFSPANVMQLLENVRGAKSSGQLLATMMQVGKKIGKKPVLVGNGDGFVGNRMMSSYFGEARMLLEEGMTPEQVDGAAEKLGFAMGPLATNDLIGWDVMWKARQALGDMRMNTKTYIGPYEVMDGLCEAGHFGQKSGQGVYKYVDGKRKGSEDAQALVERIRKAKGVVPRAIGVEEAQERLLFGLINEGFKILEEGKALRPSDIDVVFIYGYGFPKVKGGPMWFADNIVSLPKLLERLRQFDAQQAARARTNPAGYTRCDHYTPSRLLEECVRQGKTLAQLWAAKAKASKL